MAPAALLLRPTTRAGRDPRRSSPSMPDPTQRVAVGGRTLALSNLDKVLFPADGIVKAEVVAYYVAVAGAMLPHIERRPLSLVRFPDGVDGEAFFQKARPVWAPAWIESVHFRERDYLYVAEPAGLAWLANLAALELHQVPSRAPDLDRPDVLVFDLDPPEDAPFATVRRLAIDLRRHLEGHGYVPFVKTSGGKGVHLFCPLVPDWDESEVLEAARDLAASFAQGRAKAVTLNMGKARRAGRVFIDVYRHSPGQTVVAPYSLRGRNGAPVSTPLTWEEFETLDDPRELNLHTVPARLATDGDPWKAIRDHATDLHTAPAAEEGVSAGGGLEEYAAKRTAGATPEPVPAGAPRRRRSRGTEFVIQRHHARALHYDLRVEEGGVLRSWAVPKGLPPRPGIKRLAVATEDHPMEYLDFEGSIPRGQYGAGRMWVFERGQYEPLKKEDGKLYVRLRGRSMAGDFRMFRTKDQEWIIERLDVPAEDWPNVRVEPMQPTLRKAPPDWNRFEYEVKWDGIRILVHVDEGQVRLFSRRGVEFTDQFPELTAPDTLRSISAVFDGEIVCLDEEGKPSFERVLQRTQGSKGRAAGAARRLPVTCYLFDALYLDGRVVLDEPLSRRREWVEDSLRPGTPYRFSRAVTDGPAFLEAVEAMGLEGLVAKDPTSKYQPGKRTETWIKIKVRRDATVRIVGYHPGEGSLAGDIGSLHVAEPDDDALTYRGRVGSGITERDRRRLRNALEPLVRATPPLEGGAPSDAAGAVWVEPRLSCDVTFAEITGAGRYRAPVFVRLSADPAPAATESA